MLRQRVMTAVPAITVLLVVLFVLPPVVAQLVFAALIVAGAWEWSGFLKPNTRLVRFSYVGMTTVLLIAVSAGSANQYLIDVVMEAALAWWSIAFLWIILFPTPIPNLAGWVCGVLVLLPAYLAIVTLYQLQPGILLFVLVIVWTADTGAFFAGKYFGRVKLAPKVSPGKTWEGVLGGLLAVTALVLVRALWLETEMVVLLPFCLAVAIISIVGDLTVSMFKRHAGVKDSGRLFPGHGGVLDRIDSVTAAAPLFALGISWGGLR